MSGEWNGTELRNHRLIHYLVMVNGFVVVLGRTVISDKQFN